MFLCCLFVCVRHSGSRKIALQCLIVTPLTLRRCWHLSPLNVLFFFIMADTDNQFLQTKSRQENQFSQSSKFDGGSWNGSWNRPAYEKVVFGKGAVVDDRARRYDRRGRLVDLSTDRFCSFLCIGTSVPEARELARIHRLHAMLVLGGENHALTHQVSEIIGGGISLNVSI